jgi:hypothetical protein
MDKRPLGDGEGKKEDDHVEGTSSARNFFDSPEMAEYFRTSIITGVHMQMANMLMLDEENMQYSQGIESVPIYVQLSSVNALTKDLKSLGTTLTMCRTNPEPMYCRSRHTSYHEKAFFHVPYKGLIKPKTTDDFASGLVPGVIYLEYHTPLPKSDSITVVRYMVTPLQISPYKSYEAGDVQQDELDLLISSREELEKLYLSEKMATSWALSVLENWAPEPLAYYSE